MKLRYPGKKFKCLLWDDAEDQILQLQSDRAFMQLLTLINKFCDGCTLQAPGQINSEGEGFFAFKKGQLRAYFWYCSKERGVIVVSHFIYKKTSKLHANDKQRMKDNRRNYEKVRKDHSS